MERESNEMKTVSSGVNEKGFNLWPLDGEEKLSVASETDNYHGSCSWAESCYQMAMANFVVYKKLGHLCTLSSCMLLFSTKKLRSTFVWKMKSILLLCSMILAHRNFTRSHFHLKERIVLLTVNIYIYFTFHRTINPIFFLNYAEFIFSSNIEVHIN